MEIKISDIKSQFSTRKLNQGYVDFLADDIARIGFDDEAPVSITEDGILWSGNHRLAAAKKVGLTEIPCIIKNPENMRVEAHERNRVAGNNLPETFVDHAEEIWELLAEGKTQQQVAEELKYNRVRVSQFQALKGLCIETWDIVTTNTNPVTINNDSAVTKNVTVVTENLLRPITCLQPDHQHELVSDLIAGEITKSKFKALAAAYKARDQAANYVWEKLKYIDQDLLIEALEDIDSGKYDKEWIPVKGKKKGKIKPSLKLAEDTEQEDIKTFSLYKDTDKLMRIQFGGQYV